MQITLKNVKISASLSEETTAFTATLYLNGVARGTVSNRGHGDPIWFSDRQAEVELEAYAKTLPAFSDPRLGITDLPQSAEMLVGEVLERHQITTTLTRKMRQRVMYVRDGGVYETKTFTAATMPQALQHFRAKGYQILNDLPLPEAVDLFMMHG